MSRGTFIAPSDDEGVRRFEADRTDVDAEFNTSFTWNPTRNLPLKQQRKTLPAYKHRDELLYLLEKYQVVVLCGETGSGKSTQVPQYLLEAGHCSRGKMIAVTQPRRVAATSLAARVAEETGSRLGDVVGYSIRFDDSWTPGRTKIKFMTEGILVRELLADPLLQQYSAVMIDEVHERTLFTDILMGLMRKVSRKRPDLRLIISSATMDAEDLRKYFDLSKPSEPKQTAAILSVEGRTYPVRAYYLEEPAADYVKASVDTVLTIHRKLNTPGDILVFLTGVDEVDHAARLLDEEVERNVRENGRRSGEMELSIVKMYGSLPAKDQMKAFFRPPPNTRKVVLATNIAETSVTIPGIVHVVDCGFVKVRCFSADTQTDSLGIVSIPKSSAIQRAGRAGRMKPGNVYRLFPEQEFDKLEPTLPPEILRADLSPVILQLKALGITDVLRFPFPARPPAANMAAALELLYALEALDDNGELTEPLGACMAEFPVPDPRLAKMLLSSGDFGCSEEATAIAAVALVKSIFVGGGGGQRGLVARQAKRGFEAAEGDSLTALNAFLSFVKVGDSVNCNSDKNAAGEIRARRSRWCAQNFLDFKALSRALEIQSQLIKLLKRFRIPLVSAKGDAVRVRRCVAAGYFANAAILHHSGQYRTVRGGVELKIHPSSVLYDQKAKRIDKMAQCVVYTEVLHTSEVFMRDLTVVDVNWLLELAPHYYKRGYLF
ncbi:unnamed protein product [Notodromas monacha]|uniref:RNA helicase n=1 Tax=Notodromas monacha TaxID=399045 RepID=A0A7R9GIE0_9CRUS|nr:unnamed protein product [Notodromas monacha]CAG0921664.1 unnamed protein product [Notodromas monacha]